MINEKKTCSNVSESMKEFYDLKENKKMKKLFISCPMRGRTPDAIKTTYEKMHQLAEIYFGEELEVISSIVVEPEFDHETRPLMWLAKSLEKMADADYFIGLNDFEDFFRGCCLETRAAYLYGIKSFNISFDFSFLQDCRKAIDNYYSNEECCCAEDATAEAVNA